MNWLINKLPLMRLFTYAFFVFLDLACTEKQPYNDAQALSLKAAVKTVHHEFYLGRYVFDQIEPHKKLSDQYYSFDWKGRFTAVINSSASAIIDTITHHADSVIYLSPFVYEYKSTIYRYINDSLSLIYSYNIDGKLNAYQECRSKQNKLMEMRCYKACDDILDHQIKYSYNDKGLLINKACYYANHFNEERYNYGLNNKTTSSNASYFRTVDYYNSAHLLKKRKKYYGQSLQMEILYFYNKHQNLVRKQEISGSDLLVAETNYQYQYDKFDNWIEQIEQLPDGNVYIHTRKISYYNGLPYYNINKKADIE